MGGHNKFKAIWTAVGDSVSKDFGAWGAVQLIEYLSNMHKVLAFRIKPDMVATVLVLGR